MRTENKQHSIEKITENCVSVLCALSLPSTVLPVALLNQAGTNHVRKKHEPPANLGNGRFREPFADRVTQALDRYANHSRDLENPSAYGVHVSCARLVVHNLCAVVLAQYWTE